MTSELAIRSESLSQSDGSGVGGSVVVHHHVHAGYQLPQQVLAGRVVKVQRDALLASVQVEKQPAPLRMGNVVRKRTAPVRLVPPLGGSALMTSALSEASSLPQ